MTDLRCAANAQMTRRHWVYGFLTLVPVLVCAGCTALAPRDDIVSIYQFYQVEPWTQDEEKRVNGLSARVYFSSAQNGKGIFVPGPIQVRLHVLQRRPDGTYERQPAFQWVFSEQDAQLFRVTKTSTLGDSYGFVLQWPKELELAGRDIELRFSYTRTDGKEILGRPITFRVPTPFGRPAVPVPEQPGTRPAPEGSSRPASRAAPRIGSG